MRLSNRTKLVFFSLLLTLGIAFTPSVSAVGATHFTGRSGGFRSSGTHRHQGRHRFPQTGFLGFDGAADQDIVIIQQFYPAPPSNRIDPAPKGVYVQPRWVDAGYGVQLLQPGYWAEPGSAPKR